MHGGISLQHPPATGYCRNEALRRINLRSEPVFTFLLICTQHPSTAKNTHVPVLLAVSARAHDSWRGLASCSEFREEYEGQKTSL